MSDKIAELTQQRNHILSDAQKLVNNGLKTAADKQRYQELLAESDVTQGDIDAIVKIERALPSAVHAPVTVQAPVVKTKPVSSDEKRARLNVAYRSLLTDGRNPNIPEQRDLDNNSDAAGLALVPQGYEPSYVDALKWYGPIATLVKDIPQATGAPRKIAVTDDTASTMRYLPDTSATNISTAESDPSLFSRIPGVNTLVSTVVYSIEEFDDNWDLDSFIKDVAGLRVARAVEYALTTGCDSATNTQLPNSATGGLLANVPTGHTTASLSAGIGYAADLVALAGSVDHSYYVNGVYMASPSVHNYLLSQVDSTSRPYYLVDPNTGLLMINGKPLYVNNAMPAYNAASSPVVLFGDFSRALVYLHTGIAINVLKERYSDQLLRAAVISHRLGSAALVSGAVKSLVTASS